MSTELKEAPKKRARVRRNYVAEMKAVEMYLRAAIRLLESDTMGGDDANQAGQLKAYKDIQAFIEGK